MHYITSYLFQFSQDCETQVEGHEFGGLSQGGMCEQANGLGYTVVVDQVSKAPTCPTDPTV